MAHEIISLLRVKFSKTHSLDKWPETANPTPTVCEDTLSYSETTQIRFGAGKETCELKTAPASF